MQGKLPEVKGINFSRRKNSHFPRKIAEERIYEFFIYPCGSNKYFEYLCSPFHN